MTETQMARLLGQVRDNFGSSVDFEQEQLLRFQTLLNGATRFVDVGANHGLYSYFANQILTHSKIVLVEANPSLCARLQREIESWDGVNQNVLELLPLAAGNQEAIMPFKLEADDTLGSLATSDFAVYGGDTVDVVVKPLDKVLPVEPSTVFKIDVEGFEYRVLDGLRQHLSRPDCTVMVELHGWGDREISKYPFHVLGYMRQKGYAAERLEGTHFLFRRGAVYACWASYMKYAPAALIRYVARLSGLQALLRRLLTHRHP